MQYAIAGLIGLIGGIASGLFGVGGGIVMVPAMMFFMKVDPKTAIGTSLAVIIPTAIIGSMKHHHLGNVNWKLALTLAPLAIIGGYIGAHLTTYLRGDDLKRLFGGLLIFAGVRLVFFK